MSHSYTYYENLSYFSVAILVLSYIIGYITTVPFVLCGGCSFSFAYELLSITYGGKLKIKKRYDKKISKQVSLHGFELNRLTVILLFNGIISVYICAFTTFFSKLLITESTGQCNLGMDCFALNVSSRSLVQEDSLQENCLEYLSNTSYIIQCYKLSFNYASAIGSTGGILLVGSFVLKTQAALAASFLHADDVCKFILLEFLFLCIIALILGLTFGLVDEIFESAFSSVISISEFVAYLWTTFYSIVTSVYFFIFTNSETIYYHNRPVHHAKVVEHAEIVIIASEAEKNDGSPSINTRSSSEGTETTIDEPREHEVVVRRAKFVVEAKSVDQFSHVVESVSISEADAILLKDNPLPCGHSPSSQLSSSDKKDEKKHIHGNLFTW